MGNWVSITYIRWSHHASRKINLKHHASWEMLPSQVTENKTLNSRLTKNKISQITNNVKPPIPPPPIYDAVMGTNYDDIALITRSQTVLTISSDHSRGQGDDPRRGTTLDLVPWRKVLVIRVTVTRGCGNHEIMHGHHGGHQLLIVV